MERVKGKAKGRLRNKFTCVYEDTAAGQSPLEKVYTRLYLKRDSGENGQDFHENLNKFRSSDTPVNGRRLWHMGDEQIDCIGMFDPQPGSELPVRRVMMKGIAGIGKTFVIQWFSLQWAEGKSNQHIDFIFVLPFRELNLLKEGEHSLFELLCHFAPDLRELGDAKSLVDKQVLFILDGLDESRFSLDFANKTVGNPDQTSTMDVLLTNLIKGNLFPNALLWITSRPAAANRIPPQYINQTMEISGFTDRQKQEYFRKRFSDENQANKIISLTKGSLSFMSYIPIFCWIIAEVFKKEEDEQKRVNITTVTELYIQYFLIQTQRAVKKYEENRTEEMDHNLILESRTFAMFLKLAQFAFEELQKGNIIFYEEDLRRCGIDVDKASVFCGLCSEMLKEECGLYERKVFSFVHLSFQEFLAAVYMFHCCLTKNIAALKSIVEDVSADLPCHELMKRVVDKSLRSKDGQLDLFISFFLGISLEPNQTLLQGFLPQTENRSETAEEMRRYLTKPHGGNISPERQMNLFLCKYEMKAQRVQNEIQMFINSKVMLSPIYCSVLSSMLLMSEEVLGEINLVNSNIPTLEGHERLLPAIKNCRKAKLWTYTCEDKDVLTSIVQSADSSLRDLHLVYAPNSFHLGPVLATLRSPGCKLETLRLSGCPLGHEECVSLASVIQSTHSLLRELNLRYCFTCDYDLGQCEANYDDDGDENGDDEEDDDIDEDEEDDDDIDEDGGGDEEEDDNSNDDEDDGDDGANCDNSLLTVLPAALRGPTCNLETFTMIGCRLTHEDCELFASVLSSNSHLRELDLSDNDLQDSGVKLLSAGLGSPDCKLEILRLSGCRITEEGCASLATALSSNPSHLRELDLSFNHPGDSGIKLLSDRLMDPNCRLEKLNVDHDEEHWTNPQLLKKYDCQITMDPNTVHKNNLLSEGNKRIDWVSKEQPYSDHPERSPFTQVLCRESLTGRCYWEVEYPRDSSSETFLGVAYRNIARKGQPLIGYNNESWCCRTGYGKLNDEFSFLHNSEGDCVSIGQCEVGGRLHRLGVYLDWPAGILSFYMVSADAMTHLYTFKTTFAEPLYPVFFVGGAFGHLTLCRIHKFTVNETKTSFTPEMSMDSYTTVYKFRFPSEGLFQCGLTGLVFGVEGEGEVQYKTVQWDESLLLSAGRTPAGPLFSIQCPQGSVSQLQIPHCATSSALSCDGLSVVHITDDGLTILEPLRITQTHVVVNVQHLSSFGLTWLLECMFPSTKTVSSQVLLLLRPPGRRRRVLYVFMLASNVPQQEVKAQHEKTECLTTTSNCVLTIGERYSLRCTPETYELQPESELFDLNYGPNFHPTFEVFLEPNADYLGMSLESLHGRIPWRRRIDLTDCLLDDVPSGQNVQTQILSSEKKLLSVRTEFIKRVSDPVLNSLLDGLLAQRVINDEEMESAKERIRQEKARDVIDMVRRKGTKSSWIMLQLLHQLDSNLYEQLNLMNLF